MWSINKFGCWIFNSCNVTLGTILEHGIICFVFALFINIFGCGILYESEYNMNIFNIVVVGFGTMLLSIIVGMILIILYWVYDEYINSHMPKIKIWDMTIFKCKRKDFNEEENE